MTRIFVTLSIVFVMGAAPAHTASAVPEHQVPFVGCASDGQTGPLSAPTGFPKTVRLPTRVAARLAYYKAETGNGSLGPRGWHCAGLYGSNGSILFIAPNPMNAADFLSTRPPAISGPAIQVTERVGDTSGRFDVAAIIARYFPERMAFVKGIVDEKGAGLSAKDFPSGPYLRDRLIFRNSNIVEYQTPPHSEGLGTHTRLVPNGDPIRSVAVLYGDTPDVLQLTVRLLPPMSDLASPIVEQAERDVPKTQ
jgi:hypothetical protein